MLTLEQAKALKYGDVLIDGAGKKWRVNGKVKTWKRDENRVVPEFVNRLNNENIPEKYHYKSKSDKEGKVIVVGNGKFIFNR